jgi:hypothetical protein
LVVGDESSQRCVVEVKTQPFEQADLEKRRLYKSSRDVAPDCEWVFIAIEDQDCELHGLRFVSWSDVCIRLCRPAPDLMRAKGPPVCAMVLAFVAAIEQNVLKPGVLPNVSRAKIVKTALYLQRFRPYDERLRSLGLVCSSDKPDYWPRIGTAESLITVAVKVPDRSCVYIEIDFNEVEPASSMWVGTWFWSRDAQSGSDLFKLCDSHGATYASTSKNTPTVPFTGAFMLVIESTSRILNQSWIALLAISLNCLRRSGSLRDLKIPSKSERGLNLPRAFVTSIL